MGKRGFSLFCGRRWATLCAIMKSLPTDISIAGVEVSYEHHAYRTPLKFGGVPVMDAVLLNVRLRARTRTGRVRC
jgi:hypothetical protein